MANLFAIFLQSLCIKLGSVTGLNLAENCRRHLPRGLTLILYVFAESAIIATDIAEVIGSVIALNLLLNVPLVAGCVISLVDVLILLIFYNPDGNMTRLRLFECFVIMLVLGVMICFCIELSYIPDTNVGVIFKGYVPSSDVVKGNGIYLSCGILGATVMPHSIFLGSGIVQPRLKQFDLRNGHYTESNNGLATTTFNETQDLTKKYRPSIQAIRSCLKYSIVELATSLFTFALFVNSAILIVAGSSLYPKTEATEADLFGIHALLTKTLSKAAGVLFALALLLSGTSAGIVCTMAGQMVSEGMLRWTLKPWLRRLITRSISIVPSIVIAASVGKSGLNQALTASQVVLSVILPFVTAPLL
ncbi:NRAMP-like transporter smf-3 [Exophiala xenobiotica]|nr:NRAMP-like transporter smf-3 [Exophiala xenobiotica]